MVITDIYILNPVNSTQPYNSTYRSARREPPPPGYLQRSVRKEKPLFLVIIKTGAENKDKTKKNM